MLLDLIKMYGEYCSLAGDSACSFESWLIGFLSEEETQNIMEELRTAKFSKSVNHSMTQIMKALKAF